MGRLDAGWLCAKIHDETARWLNISTLFVLPVILSAKESYGSESTYSVVRTVLLAVSGQRFVQVPAPVEFPGKIS